jgi:hypothetical protein
MNLGKTLFAQVMGLLPWKTFHRIVDRHDGDCQVRSMTCALIRRGCWPMRGACNADTK